MFSMKKRSSNKKIAEKFCCLKKKAYLCTRNSEMTRKMHQDAPVAQLVEHLTLNQGVQGSNPCGCTKKEDEKRPQLGRKFLRGLFYFAENQIDTNLTKVLFLNRYDRELNC